MRFLALLLPLLALSAQAAGRLALVVGENRGASSEEQLRFAELDAQRFGQALLDVGGFAPGEVTVLAGATAAQVRSALSQLRSQGPKERLVLYVSSHASEGVLHLAGTELPLQELVDFLKQAPAQVGLLVVDACQSGQVTRMKGVKAVGPAAPRLEASDVEGRVLISASGADEYAQESDALQGSYFTHYFLAGLRGAADSSRDGQVTLEEVYAWAWARTIEATWSSRGGVQRPAFSVELRGAGQLVLGEPKRSPGRLTLEVQAPGRWLVVAADSGAVFADVDKGAGPLTLAVPPGRYRVQLRVDDGVLERAVEVPAEGGLTLTREALTAGALTRVVRKGGEESQLLLSLGASVSSGLVNGLAFQPGAELRLRRDGHLAGPLNQLSASFGFRAGEANSFQQQELELRFGVGHRFFARPASLSINLELGPLLVLQGALPDASSRTSLGLCATLGLEGRVVLVGPLELFLLGTAGGAVVKKLAGPTVVPRLGVSLGLGFVF